MLPTFLTFFKKNPLNYKANQYKKENNYHKREKNEF